MEPNTDFSEIEALRNGFAWDKEAAGYVCLECGAFFAQGEVFPSGSRFFEARKAVAEHVKTHGDRLERLMESGSRYTGLTGNQKELFRRLRAGLSDAEIAAQMGVALSTVRHQRFVFREKARQAQMYLAMYELLPERERSGRDALQPLHRGAKMVDDRYASTEAEREETLKSAFESLDPLRLRFFPAREKRKLHVLSRIAEEFQEGRRYSEQEINAVLKAVFHDFATLRRYLIEYGFLERTVDCREYWRK